MTLIFFEEIEYLGDFTINGHKCFKILCTTSNGFSIAKYIDKNSGLIWAELTVAHDAENGPVKTWTTFENYHNKLMLPNRTITKITEQTPYAIGTSTYIATVFTLKMLRLMKIYFVYQMNYWEKINLINNKRIY